MRVEIVTLFPELFERFVSTSLVARAIERGLLSVRLQSPREFGLGKHRAVDDTPYGGGSGMVMRVDCLVAAFERLDELAAREKQAKAHRILLTPQGSRLDQRAVVRIATLPAMMLVCGRYEGFDERVRAWVDEEVSIGDFVLTGGEVAAMAIVEATVRLLPGVLGNEQSLDEESHHPASGGLLEYPHYTRPPEFRSARVPDVLQSGNHAEIARWRRAQSIERTRARRPDITLPEPPATPKKRRRAHGHD